MIPKMIRYASEKHEGQVRKNGRPYFRHHCLGLLEDVCNDHLYGNDLEAHLIILGHDIIEDCTDNDTDEERKDLAIEISSKFSIWTSYGILELTNEYSKKRYPELNRRDRKSRELLRLSTISKRGKALKLYDRRANLLDHLADKDYNRVYAKESFDLARALVNNQNCVIASSVMRLSLQMKELADGKHH